MFLGHFHPDGGMRTEHFAGGGKEALDGGTGLLIGAAATVKMLAQRMRSQSTYTEGPRGTAT